MSKTMRARADHLFQRRLLSVALGVALAGSANAAVATDPPSSSQSAGEQAAKFYQEGNQAFTQKRWQDAEAAYLKAWAIVRSFDVAANLGEVELHLDKPRQAAELLSYALRNAPPSAKPAQRERTRHFLDDAKAKVHTLRVSVRPKEARVLLDGAPIDPSLIGEAMGAGEPHRGGDEVFVDAGQHTVEATLDGYTPQQRVVTATAGTSQMFAFFLERAPEKATGVGAPSASSTPPPPVPTVPPPRPLWPVGVGGGATAVLLAGGIGFTAVANGHRADSRSFQKQIDASGAGCINGANAATCGKLDDALAKTDTFRNLALAGFIGAGITGAATLAYVLWPSPKPEGRGAVRMAPVIGAGNAGMFIEGSF